MGASIMCQINFIAYSNDLQIVGRRPLSEGQNIG